MTEKFNTHDVTEEKGSVQTVAEFDALVEVFKVQNPVAYAQQLANGELEAFRKTLKDYVPPEKEVEVATSSEDKPQEALKPRGRPSKK